ncbi:hypothetical protein L3556_09065 [Candidatus Synechococcus calcipolaris G9]|uniref:Uncharacterized protein n=1 Tax=Candidatus Synechococcus calcipolaris G9 TaxID=1497997 RepID=A0ABT6EZR8_9SYNE|nr:hypothetical protein [Candidatus Synechococcus calcipolaris]MDG2991073.1 hypothetical protein [Candidatus Synechococcus calcipolaris G9]
MSLVKHFLQQRVVIKRVVLLHTTETATNAQDTQEWLLSEVATLTAEAIALFPVSAAFSADPINQLLAVHEARQALEKAKKEQSPQDRLELNGSSGTPTMKSCWSILQAMGFAPRSHVWQIRNPKKMQPGQARVFAVDVNALKNEVDNQLIQCQVRNYNYQGALISLQNSSLASPVLEALLNYGYYRQVRDFDRAFNALYLVKDEVDSVWLKEIATLRRKEMTAILRDAYFQAQILLKLKRYAEFLVVLSGLHENLIRFLVTDRNHIGLQILTKPGDRDQAWTIIRQFDQGQLYQFLQGYRLPSGMALRVSSEDAIGRFTLIAILDYFPDLREVVLAIKEINEYCDRRNEAVHQLAGVSAIEDQEKLLKNLRRAIQFVVSLGEGNPFDRLNKEVCGLLDRAVAGV